MADGTHDTTSRIARLGEGFGRFFELEVAGAVVLLGATVVALVLANSALADTYHAFWQIELGFSIGHFEFSETLLHWIDDGLMALFFLVVGLEIKREVLVGDLSSGRKAALPIFAAVGGMALPAIIYLFFNAGGEGAAGWGVPMATDIAFALGVLALLGSRVPIGLKVFLTALAIVDDIGAILVIAIFYTDSISYGWLAAGLLLLLLLILLNVIGVDDPAPYLAIGTIIWFSFLHSGIHATLAGVLVAFTIPATAKMRPLEFVEWTKEKLAEIEEEDVPGAHVLEDPAQQECALEIRSTARYTAAPLQRLEHSLLPYTNYIILPLFALANAGVTLVDYDLGKLLLEPVTLGVFFGLMFGKTFGVTLMAWLAVRLHLADLPDRVEWRHIWGTGMIAGIGFTMSLFISNLAFRNTLLRAEAKLGIIVTSLIAGVVGYLFLRYVAPSAEEVPRDEPAAEAA